MSGYVVDASVAVKWFVDEPYSLAAFEIVDSGASLHAPDFFRLELDNFFCKQVRRGRFSVDKADDARLMLAGIPLEYHPFADLQDHAYRLAHQTRRSSVYDCLYLALAFDLDARLVTADRRFFNEVCAGPFKRRVLWLADLIRPTE